LFAKYRRVALALLALLTVWAACSESEEARVQAVLEYAPNANPELVRHLLFSDDSTLTRYARKTGAQRLRDTHFSFYRGFRHDSIESYERSASILFPVLIRVSEILEREYGLGKYLIQARIFEQWYPEEGMRYHQLVTELNTISGDMEPGVEKIERTRAVAEGFIDLGTLWTLPDCHALVAGTYHSLGDRTAAEKHYRFALAGAREHQRPLLECQMLGALGGLLWRRGEVDSMKVCYDEALETARRHSLSNQEARIISFYAGHYAREGRLSLAHRFFDEAARVAGHYGSSHYELRYINESLRWHADLGVWETVGRTLPRAFVILHSDTDASEEFVALRSRETSEIQARYLMAAGEYEAADTIFTRLAPEFERIRLPAVYADFLHHWAAGLIQNGRWEYALDVISKGLQVTERGKFDPKTCGFSLLEARASLEIGDYESARNAIERFDRLAPGHGSILRSEWHERDALVVKLHLAQGDRASAYAAVDVALDRVADILEGIVASAEGYLWLGQCHEIREVLHDLAAGDPQLGFGIELYWRDLYRRLGGEHCESSGRASMAAAAVAGDGPNEPRAFGQMRHLARVAQSFFRDRSAVHCLYAALGNDVVRWTCTAAGMDRETLGVSAADLSASVAQARTMMAADPGHPDAPASRELETTLGNLAEALLSTEILSASGTGSPLYVSTVGFLSQIPFEALNVSGGGGYEPLLIRRDVVYTRHIDDTSPAPRISGNGVIVANPEPPGRAGSVLSSGRDAAGVVAEGAMVASVYKDAIFLQGASATKANLLRLWENASFAYIAGHVVREADVPYLALIPLAPTELASGPDAVYLDVGDIRAADLSGCGLVVLSGCASGALYVGLHNTAPSLGDAFLDSGAGAVVQTFWDVRDDQAQQLMSSFVRRWDGTSAGAIHALGEARREAMIGPDGVRHPFAWAAYSVKLNLR
jgi:tetratricopeptide (TPR) repeat protein